MNKKIFIDQLSTGLKKIGIIDSDEIIRDYESHFDNEVLKGKTEEEISHELGKISDILVEFQSEKPSTKSRKAMSVYSLIISDIFIYMGMISLYLLNLSAILLSLGSLLLGIYLMFMMNVLDVIPVLVFPFAQFSGLSFIALSVTSFGLSVIQFKFYNTLMKRLSIWHKEIIRGRVLHQVIKVNQSKLINQITLWSAIGLITFMIISYIIGIVLTGDVQFWKVWRWFN